jgi:hypothetical protein
MIPEFLLVVNSHRDGRGADYFLALIFPYFYGSIIPLTSNSQSSEIRRDETIKRKYAHEQFQVGTIED